MQELPRTIGRYVVRERLGQGGMGMLYLALDPAIDRLVAVKLLAVQSAELKERFLREAGLAGRLQHPNIVTVFDVGTHEGQPFIAMEYIPGETLSELIQRRGIPGVRRRLELMVEACQGLAFAHRHGIVHRDVKPANLMVSRDSGALKVLDFGIARGLDSSLTQAGMVMGTPNYMSPEQLEGRSIDQRSDVFALGLVLYELLVYRQAFSGQTPQAVWHRIALAQPTPVRELDPTLDEGIGPIVDRAIAKRVDDRYPDLDAMRADLLRIIHRLQSMQSGDTLIDAAPPVAPATSAVRRPAMARLAERRATQIAAHLRRADESLAAGELEHAQEAAEEAALLDPDDPRVVVVLDRIRHESEARETAGIMAEADAALRAGSLTAAAGLVARVLQLSPTDARALAFRDTLQQAIEARERSQERARVVSRALEQAEAHLAAGAIDAALRATSEALGYDPDSVPARELKARLTGLARQRADEILALARADYDARRYTAALRRLEAARPRDERIEALEAEIRQAWAASREETSDLARPPAPPVAPEGTGSRQAPTSGYRQRLSPATDDAPAPARPPTPAHPLTPARPSTPARPLSGSAPAAAATPRPGTSTPAESRRPTGSSGSHTRVRASVPSTPDERRAQALAYLDRARQHLGASEFARALSLVDAALALEPARTDAHELRRHIDQAWADSELARPAQTRGAGG